MSERVATISFGTAPAARVTFGYTDPRDVITSVQNQAGSPLSTVSSYTYRYDDAGRRTSVANTGTAFSNDAFSLWAYNARSELTSSERWSGDYVVPPNSEMITSEYRLYDYDAIGNWNYAQHDVYANGRTRYMTNSLNQYEQLCWIDCELASLPLAHDADGNLTQDGQFAYTWDAENRLVAVEPSQPSQGDWRVVFDYDYMSRRVRKRVYLWDETLNEGAGDWGTTLEQDLRFVYDQWNVVEVLSGAGNQLSRKYTWGLDLSGQAGNSTTAGIHGSGGIGGLLAVEETAATGSPSYWFFYDANGNVGQIVNASNPGGTPAARYEYDAYGNEVVAAGTYATTNPFRFSTKWLDAGGYYYGYRHYSPMLGRWLSRDPIGDRGGSNIYVAIRNAPVARIDVLGLFSRPWHEAITSEAYPSHGRPANWDAIAIQVEDTDYDHFFDPAYHAQSSSWTSLVKFNMDFIRNANCGDSRYHRNMIIVMGNVIHTLQDVYAHTDYVDGNGGGIMALYFQYALETGDWSFVETPVVPGHSRTLDLKALASGSGLDGPRFLYWGGTVPGTDVPHNWFAADKPGYGRDAVVIGAFSRARRLAVLSTAQFLDWVYMNTTCSCREAFWGKRR